MKENKECTKLTFYHVVTDTNLEALEIRIGELLHDDWDLDGKLIILPNRAGIHVFYQVMVM